MDIDELRDAEIQLHGLTKADGVYTFYHDETNNIRKLYIDDGRLNVAELKVFVLGGIVHEGAPRPIEIQSLREAMRIQKTAPEIKLEHVAKGNFLDVLRSRKLTTFLRWLIDNGLMIHYHELDPFYRSVADIIDSIVPELGNPMLLQYHVLLKSDLVAVLRCELAATIQLFHDFGYPGLSPEGRRPFLDRLIEILERNSDVLRHFNAMMLKGVLQAGRALESLEFIEGYYPNLLIDEFSTFYQGRIAIFKNSTHIFDMEKVIHDRLLETPLTSQGKPVANFRFADSKAELGLQISDVIVGVLGKMHTYFTNTGHEDVAADREALAGTSLENAKLLSDLISASHAANVTFLHHVASVHDIDKLDLFLRFPDGAHVA
ncbi:DUF3800 domain-containing protein [Bradyrhizobium japonicum]|uniref:DUF3800 domain-containing protein n=1 Tax=Bradyrhizobium japonicum TaxID=375 RepID=UPI001E3FADF0|nr:DUF3800 domain-containing protein [Bradyrhizobium japonicum]MCD9823797.1 DUF3800 domain-containing protein [Bradyrhizobium japonicum]MEB2677830.1 DUF3800 domain-containing protein [Bradyrhizobium japonicum]WRI88097.1 DUF3800 domain-containing protein [Bradyrhizobium japonicum]